MFTKYENGAEVNIDEVYRYASGAEQEAEAAYAYKNGAEEVVWINDPYTFNTLSHPCTTFYGDGAATVVLSWAAQSGVDGYFYIMGDFVAG